MYQNFFHYRYSREIWVNYSLRKMSTSHTMYHFWICLSFIKDLVSPYLTKSDVQYILSVNRKMQNLFTNAMFQKTRYTLYNVLKFPLEKISKVEHVIIYDYESSDMGKNNIVFLTNLKSLVIKSINQELSSFNPITFPSKLLKLSISFAIVPLFLELPNNLQELSLGWTFDQPLKPGFLPMSLKVLDFGTNFNQSIESLNILVNLIHLKLGWCFNHPIIQLPPNLLSLEMIGYNRDLPNLPPHLEKLVLGTFNALIPIGVLPSSLKKLKCKEYTQKLTNGVLPKDLECLTLEKCDDYESNSLPKNLKYLKLPIAKGLFPFPDKVQVLHICSFSPNLILPISLIELHLNHWSNIYVDVVPTLTNLTKLKIGLHIALPYPKMNMNKLPDSLKEITLGYRMYFVVKRSFNPFLLFFNKKLIRACTN